MKFSIRLLYLYLFSFIGLIIAVIGSISLVDLGLKVYLFKGADRYDYIRPSKIEGQEINLEEEKMSQEKETTRSRQRQASNAISMLLVGIPLYKYHWRIIKKESKS